MLQMKFLILYMKISLFYFILTMYEVMKIECVNAQQFPWCINTSNLRNKR